MFGDFPPNSAVEGIKLSAAHFKICSPTGVDPVNAILVMRLDVPCENGTGKEVLAQAVHTSSQGGCHSFMTINCAAIAESLIESELFGYTFGTFTRGRSKGAKGLIQQASGGTLFLDEIGDMPLHLQTRLLRVLAEGQVLPVGAVKPIEVDIRVLSATHCDITQLIEAGRLREDLFYRLNGATLKLPALKARTDMHYLIKTLLKRINPELRLRADAMSALLAYEWPGNIRQLANTLTFAEVIGEADEITVHYLPQECVTHQWESSSLLMPMQAKRPKYVAVNTLEDGAALLEQQTLVDALRRQRWNISAVAKQLRVSRPTIYRRIKKHHLILPKDLPFPALVRWLAINCHPSPTYARAGVLLKLCATLAAFC